ncbi:MAG: glycerol-3-phosphate 1-O-acyltransferase PlsY [Nitrospirota bacterium]|jgi:glycerol-3-phosphate acyltransferase PlsY
MTAALVIAFSYLLGSVPFGMVFARAKGVDLRSVGSGNIGATNVLRAAGRGPAVLTLLGDALKGAAAVVLARALGLGAFNEGLAALAAVAGHDFSVFLRFRGGKGVATSLGAVLIYAPQAGILTAVLWLITVVLTRYSSLGAIVSFALLPVVMLLTGQAKQKAAVAVALSALLVLKHSGNIKRLVEGTERRVGEKA